MLAECVTIRGTVGVLKVSRTRFQVMGHVDRSHTCCLNHRQPLGILVAYCAALLFGIVTYVVGSMSPVVRSMSFGLFPLFLCCRSGPRRMIDVLQCPCAVPLLLHYWSPTSLSCPPPPPPPVSFDRSSPRRMRRSSSNTSSANCMRSWQRYRGGGAVTQAVQQTIAFHQDSQAYLV
jgi:hypothetical protein